MKIQIQAKANLNKVFNKSNLFYMLFSFLLFSQVPISFIALHSGIENRVLMIITRGIIVFFSIFILIKLVNLKLNAWTTLAISFWVFYIIRLYIDVAIFDVKIFMPIWEILAWGIGASLIPSIALNALSLNIKNRIKPNILIYFGILSLGISLLLFTFDFNILDDKFALPHLNPIPAGHAGVSLYIISLSCIFNNTQLTKKYTFNFISLLGVGIGAIITFSSSTRSAFIALVITTIIILFHLSKSITTRNRILITGISTIFISITYMIFGGSGLIEKMNSIGRGDSELTRLVLINKGIQSWIDKPLFGTGFEMHEILNKSSMHLNLYYPHNFIIESLLIGGLILTTIITLLMLSTTMKAFALMSFSTYEVCLVCLWTQSLIYVMFSGHLGNVPIFWFSSALVSGRHEFLTYKKLKQ